jgi:hypothetical protein
LEGMVQGMGEGLRCEQLLAQYSMRYVQRASIPLSRNEEAVRSFS